MFQEVKTRTVQREGVQYGEYYCSDCCWDCVCAEEGECDGDCDCYCSFCFDDANCNCDCHMDTTKEIEVEQWQCPECGRWNVEADVGFDDCGCGFEIPTTIGLL